MSDVVSGGISRGSGDQQATITFKGVMKKQADWEAFIEEVTQVAHKHHVDVFQFPQSPVPKARRR